MNLKQLNTFVHVAELGSLSKASDRLRTVQPALSRQIRMLEDELGVELFSRHGRGMALTEAGDLLRTRALAILRQLEETKADISEHAGLVRGRVVLGIPPTVGDVLAARLVKEFLRQYPDVTLRIVPAFTGFLLDWLQRGEIDVAIMYKPEKSPSLLVEELIVENLFLVANRSENLSPHDAVPFASLQGKKLILPGPNHGLRLLVEHEARRSGLELDVPIEADSLQTLKDLVIAGLGSTILPLASVHNEIAQDRLTATALTDPALSRKLIIAQPLGRPLSNAVLYFLETLRRTVRELVELDVWDGRLLTE